ncbi:MAG: xylose ABC transporter ATP-binding protein [Caldibacillus debilis]|uniref:xylose ABC transporter ATP-binding protein n=1 Tax=Caldibacillus debilis TaxID=301148 RepID=UPI000E38A14D|nr:xylose ABC transporter ATP-binding protein [Caldibacillus debilis]REJ13508.1 MAG: xylose ABC transporter ATP-binding protein [Caldibacillus debilis]
MEYILQMKGITKEFPGVRALNNVTFFVKKGEIHALCGENGAGKSTLMKILTGVYPYGTYKGEIYLDGKEVKFKSIKESQDAGIAIIHQELALVEEMSVAENILLSNDLMRRKYIDWNLIFAESLKWLKEVGLEIDPQTKVKQLSVGKQQLVEIAKALTLNAKIIVLDEPTAALTKNEVEVLMGILRNLKKKGVTCIYISHKLSEVLEIADTVTVLRDGETIGTDPIEKLTEETIITKMVGRKITDIYPYKKREIGPIILEVNDWAVVQKSTGKKIINHVSFSLKKGEILGIAGLMGAGRTELFSSLVGYYPGHVTGTIKVDGKEKRIRNPRDAIEAGIAYVSEDRKRYGLVLGMNIIQNTTLSSLKKVMRYQLIDQTIELKTAQEINDKVKLKAPNLEIKVSQLSGGNQQKVVISKWLLNDPKVLILDEPTRGIDVGAKYEIYKIINELATQGVGIILISSELPEILGMSDRVLVMAGGQITGELKRDEASQEKIMTYATGGTKR